MRTQAVFPLATQVRSREGAPLGEVFSFLSGLYFRGKIAYARAFARAPRGLPGALVISPTEGLRYPDERVTADRLRAWAEVDIDVDDPRYLAPLSSHIQALATATEHRCRVVLLGSVATSKYVKPLSQVLGDRLVFPADFVGRGDMSRGSLLLRATRQAHELTYAPVSQMPRQGGRPLPAAALRPYLDRPPAGRR